MHSTKLPGFTAELSIYKMNWGNYQIDRNINKLANTYNVVPQLRMTANNGLNALYLDWLCARLGGGMSSNGDGSVSCDF